MATSEHRSRIEAIERKLEHLPRAPGVYLLLGARGNPIYIGKASNLRARVRSYFRTEDDGRTYYPFLIKAVRDLEWIVTHNEKEALLLEDTLLKQHRPRFNVKLVDDKTYLSLKVTTRERFPRALLVRRPQRDGSLYFGPYDSASAIRRTLDVVRKHFKLRTCSNMEFRQRKRPCIQYQMGRCGAPCVGLQSEADYRRGVDDALLFLKGKTEPLLERLRKRMGEHAEKLEFEAAARIRNQIAAIERSSQSQQVIRHDGLDRDVFGFARESEVLRVQVLHVREGRLSANEGFTVRTLLPDAEALEQFFHRYYASGRVLPSEILFPLELEQRSLYEQWLSERRGRRVRIVNPRRGAKRRLLELAAANAKEALRLAAEQSDAIERALATLEDALGLRTRPRRIACLDISNTGGALAVGALITMQDGAFDRSGYRRFKVRDLELRGDVPMVREVAERYLRRFTASGRGKRREKPPDLLLVDGGRAQLAVVVEVLERLGLAGAIETAAIAKDHDARGNALRARGRDGAERIFRPGRPEPILLEPGSKAMHLLQSARDEAHRFAIGYHRKLRRRRALRKGLEEIPGVGPKRRRALLEHFGSLERLGEASLEEIAACPGIGPKQAEAIHAFFQETAP